MGTRILFFLLLALSFLHSFELNPSLLLITHMEARLFPKIALLEKKIAQNNPSNLSIGIIYDENDLLHAQAFEQAILSTYPHGVSNHTITIYLLSAYEAFPGDLQMLISLEFPQSILETIAQRAKENHILSFCFDPYALQYGFAVSLYLGNSTQPYFNKSILQEEIFEFDPYLLKIGRFYIKN